MVVQFIESPSSDDIKFTPEYVIPALAIQDIDRQSHEKGSDDRNVGLPTKIHNHPAIAMRNSRALRYQKTEQFLEGVLWLLPRGNLKILNGLY